MQSDVAPERKVVVGHEMAAFISAIGIDPRYVTGMVLSIKAGAPVTATITKLVSGEAATALTAIAQEYRLVEKDFELELHRAQ